MPANVPGVNAVRTDQAHQRPAPLAGDVRITRGPREGQRLGDCDDGFLKWLAENSKSELYRTAAAEVLAVRAASASPAKAATAPRAVFRCPLEYVDDPGAYPLPWGPYKGQRLDQLPDHFLNLVARENSNPDVRALAEAVIADRAGVAEGDPFQVGPR
jgi:hypothetical protein